MDGSSLFMLGIILLSILPTLGFFSFGGAILFLLLFVFIYLFYFKRISLIISDAGITGFCIFILLTALFYYGGFYQGQYFKAIGQILFAVMIALILFNEYLQKRKTSPFLFTIFYVLIGIFTLVTSPNPHVDTVVVFREAPLKFIQGINPYEAVYSTVYPNIKPDYYNHLPITFLVYLPFALIPFDQRISVLVMTVASFMLLYKSISPKFRSKAILPLSLVMFMPGSFYMLEHMYSETMIFFFFSFFIFLRSVSEKWSHLFLSLFFTVKQNLLLVLPFYVTRHLFKSKNSLFFSLPFILVLLFFVWNPAAFIDDVILDLFPQNTASPVTIALTFVNLLKYLLPDSVALSFIRTSGIIIFVIFYFVVSRNNYITQFKKTAIILFSAYYFSHYAYFNSYYLVLLFFLFSFIDESYIIRLSPRSNSK